MDLGLDGARGLVCGASRGLGAAIAQALAGEGAQLALTSRDQAAVSAAAEPLGAAAIAADLSTVDGPAAAVDGAVAALGGLDLLVVNSGGPPAGAFADLDEDAWLQAIDGTFLSPSACCAPRCRTCGRATGRQSSSSSRRPCGCRSPSSPPRTRSGRA